jgi:hypothetical protein
LAALPDPAQALAIVRASAIPSDADFFELARFARGARDLADVAAAGAFGGDEFTRDERSALVDVTRDLERASPGESGFHLDDSADPELAALRDAAERAREAAALGRSRSAASVARALGREVLASPHFIVMRDELAGPLPEGARVVGEGATYIVCELALDDDALAALAASEAAEAAVAAAEERVRRELGERIARHAPALASAAERCGAFDTFAARVRFAQRYPGCVPDFTSDAELELVDARYVPLEQRVSASDRGYVPISIAFEGAAVVTGPNMGGKTMALRTVGFALACAAYGVPVPARSARLPLASRIAWLGGGSLEADALALSAFGREVIDARAVLDEMRPAAGAVRVCVVLLDEFARTTSPREGRALLAAVLETLRARGALALAATHFDGVAAAAGAAHFATAGLRESLGERGLDLPSALRVIARAMEYRLVRVEDDGPSRSDALELAAALGLDGAVIARAREVLGS